MSPKTIVGRAQNKGLDFIALTDHNSSLNCPALAQSAHSTEESLDYLFGVEAQTQEEVHILCLFDDLPQAKEFGAFLRKHLPPVENDEEVFEYQVVVNKDEEIIGKERRLLANSLQLGINQLTEEVRERGGLVIPAHVDRKAYGMVEQLGFIPQVSSGPFLAVEIDDGLQQKEPENPKLDPTMSKVTFSDAHHPEEIGSRYTEFKIEDITIDEIKLALQSREGRDYGCCKV